MDLYISIQVITHLQIFENVWNLLSMPYLRTNTNIKIRKFFETAFDINLYHEKKR